MEEDKKSDETEDFSLTKEISSWITITFYALIYGLFLAYIVFTHSSVPTGSMSNTINIDDKLIGFRLAYLFKNPQRYDIAIFKYPDEPETLLVKRIIGLPGETINIVKGKIYINDEDIPTEDSFIFDKKLSNETLGPFVIPDGNYFMVGDNRNDSLDSRFWDNTFVKEDEIISKVFFSFYPDFKILLFENQKYE